MKQQQTLALRSDSKSRAAPTPLRQHSAADTTPAIAYIMRGFRQARGHDLAHGVVTRFS